MMKIKIKDLLDLWNPFLVIEKIDGIQKMSEYIFGHRNGIHIIDLQKLSYFLMRL